MRNLCLPNLVILTPKKVENNSYILAYYIPIYLDFYPAFITGIHTHILLRYNQKRGSFIKRHDYVTKRTRIAFFGGSLVLKFEF